MLKITSHTMAINEERWIWYALMSVKDHMTEMLVTDDGSDDKTAEIIKTIKDKKIRFETVPMLTPKAHTDMRNEMVEKTKTDWFMLLDGDEVWNYKTLERFLAFLENQNKNTIAVVMRTRNCIGDVFHYLPESAGKYQLLGKKGHLTIRAYRKLPGYFWKGENWPFETYCNPDGKSVNGLESNLSYFDGFYWHMTHLPRTSSTSKVFGWRKIRHEMGIEVKEQGEFPEVFSLPRPNIVPSPWEKMTLKEKTIAAALTPLKKIRRLL